MKKEDRDVINKVSYPAPAQLSENKLLQTQTNTLHYLAWIYLYFMSSKTKTQLFECEAHEGNIVFYDTILILFRQL